MRRILGKLGPVLVLVMSSLALPGCGGDRPAESASDSSTVVGGASATSGSELEGTITVAGAKSLTDAFSQIRENFIAANPSVEVILTFDSSAILATQILEGAPADLFASADESNMSKLTDEGLIAAQPSVFATNELIIVTKPGNPQGVTNLADLAGVGVIAFCGEEVPCGKYAEEALDAAGVSIPESSITRGQNATATLTAVAAGDAVAGIVYRTDALAAGDAVQSIELPDEDNVIATYPIGVLRASSKAEVAEAFMTYVLSDEGQATLSEFGFLARP